MCWAILLVTTVSVETTKLECGVQMSAVKAYRAMMTMFVWRIKRILTVMGTTLMEGEWKCATMEPIGQCVMMDGQTMMLLQFVCTWDTPLPTIAPKQLEELNLVCQMKHLSFSSPCAVEPSTHSVSAQDMS
jgi:hypothetical protein